MAPRLRRPRRAARLVLPLLALVVAATACLPPFRGPAGGPKAVLFGDSLLFTADFSGAIDTRFDAVGWQRAVVSGIAVGVNVHRNDINQVPASGARAALLDHGTTEANRASLSGAGATASMDRSAADLVGAVDALAPVPCVVLVTVNQHGGTPTFNSWASRYNWAILALDLNRPNVRVLDWSGRSFGHPEWFSDDGVHFTEAGKVAYSEAVAGAVAAC